MLGLAANKAIALTSMLTITIIAAMLPLYVRRKLQHKLHLPATQKGLSCCLCFGGGVLFATVFVHLLPETRMFVQRSTDAGFLPRMSYPLAELIVCVGFFIIYIAEETVETFSSHRHHSHHSSKPHSHDGKQMKPQISENGRANPEDLEQMTMIDHMSEKEKSDARSGGVTDDVLVQKGGIGAMKAVMVVVALSFHSIMEGLALGLVAEVHSVWFLFGALCAHKIFIAFCIGMELIEIGVPVISYIIAMCVFSVASPIGGLIGSVVVSYSTDETAAGILIPTFLQGISAGTILYVTFCEVLERERAKPEGSKLRMFAIIIGFSFMAALQVLDAEPDPAKDHTELFYAIPVTPAIIPSSEPEESTFDYLSST